MMSPAPRSPLFPYTTLFRSAGVALLHLHRRRGGFGQRRAQPRIEIGETLAVFGRDGDRLAEAKLVGLEHAGLAGAALALVGDENRGLARFAHKIGERAVGRRRPRARVDQE